jgi:hypothetical protein
MRLIIFLEASPISLIALVSTYASALLSNSFIIRPGIIRVYRGLSTLFLKRA